MHKWHSGCKVGFRHHTPIRKPVPTNSLSSHSTVYDAAAQQSSAHKSTHSQSSYTYTYLYDIILYNLHAKHLVIESFVAGKYNFFICIWKMCCCSTFCVLHEVL